MNKLVKGSIAGAAGIALLLGGVGSLALWNDSESLTAASVASGKLTLDASAGTWTTNPALWVPGDKFEYTTTLAITATGTNLHAKLAIDSASITSTSTALKGALVVTVAPVGAVPSGWAINPDGSYTITPQTAAYSVPVKATVTFPSTIDGTTAQNETVNLSGLAFTLKQF